VACTLDLLGDRWTLLVVRDLFVGKERFDEFLSSSEGIASNILSDRLARLTSAGLVEQRPNPDHRGRATYHLTPRGASLESVITAVASWGLENLPGTSLSGSPLDPSPGGKRKVTKRRRRSSAG
jgi:DNA-binding HxlR family transcriptional regulator